MAGTAGCGPGTWVFSSKQNTAAAAGGFKVQADHVTQLRLEARVCGQLEGLRLPRRDPPCLPYPGHRVLADPVPGRNRPRRPARRAVLGHRVQRVMHDRFHNIVAEHNRAATPRPDAPHRGGSLRGEPATPPTDRLRPGRAPTSDLGVRNTVRGPQQRLGLAHLASRRDVRTSKTLQLSPLSTRHLESPSRSHDPTHTTTDHYLSDTSPVYPIGGTLAKCDPFGTPSTSHWTGAAIIVQSPRTKTCTVTRSRTSTRPMPFSLAG